MDKKTDENKPPENSQNMNFDDKNSFALKHGFQEKPMIQVESMTPDLKNGLWNIVLARLFGKLGVNQYGEISQEYHIFINLQKNFFKLPMDELEKSLSSRREWYKDIFFTMECWKIYDMFEFVARKMIPYDAAEWERDTNSILEQENSGFRLIAKSLIPVFEVDSMLPISKEVLPSRISNARPILESFSLAENMRAIEKSLEHLGDYWKEILFLHNGSTNSDAESQQKTASPVQSSSTSERLQNACKLASDSIYKTLEVLNNTARSPADSRVNERVKALFPFFPDLHQKLATSDAPWTQVFKVTEKSQEKSGAPKSTEGAPKPTEGAPTAAETQLILEIALSLVTFLIRQAVTSGALDPQTKVEYRAARADPFGERKR